MKKELHISKTSRCLVIGHGSWATALVKVLTMNEPLVDWYVRNPEVMESLRTEGRNCRYLSDVEFDMNKVHLSDDLNASVNEAGIVFLVTPAAYLKSYLSSLKVPLDDKMVVSAIKGIIPDENQFVTDYLKQHYGLSGAQICLISGPTHAEEVGHGRLTYMTLASSNIGKTRIVGEKLQTPFFKVNYVRNMRYLERSAVLKNIYAVLVGMAVGLGYGDNFISVLVSNCIKEMYFLLNPQNINDLTKFTPSNFFGDLLVSCYSSHSRNRQLGVLIGRGNTVKTALNEMTMVAEGYFASAVVPMLAKEHHHPLPIAEKVYQILHQGLSARKALKELEDSLM
ncbi:MAG: glycerol-3-phosphate dehydrogenase [Bacteroidales bacterium]|nr:glycerol-3-phosphate dehydrogenase [Bacteroidales bacterium]